uniref:EF-hand domain-containing protein n=1 Tax=Alexandrium catenella TaxID=2925 RepID=A0A7S1MM81_ALECA|mmetsp:Transcript_29784/g.80568  ORF Transcript_29784/g.80568 Transcript_29784/m.80568 type:complete len:461 (+) Transcript_29784:46-1428(+)
MPGTRDRGASAWFEELFGFRERDYVETRNKFDCCGEVLTSKVNGKSFHIGPFDLPTVAALRARRDKAIAAAPSEFGGSGITFRNIIGNTRELHLAPESAGAVFQVASLFNCLETTQAGRGPEAGISSYASRSAQGPMAAMACPAAAIYRNYFVNGTGQLNNSVDCLSALGRFVRNDEHKYWTMVRGYCLPVLPNHLAELSLAIAGDRDYQLQAQSRVQVGIHWDTEVLDGSHKVCQVCCSALPVSQMQQRPTSEWNGLAEALLEAAFKATLMAGTIVAAERGGDRVRVYLTAVGSGALGNQRQWIRQALHRALMANDDAPLDVMLVHHTEVPPEFDLLEEKLLNMRNPKLADSRLETQLTSLKKTNDYLGVVEGHGESEAEKLSAAFAYIDANGDGVIDRRELMHALTSIDEDFFTANVVNLLFDEADCAKDGVIHYLELVNWLCSEDEDIKSSICRLAQ